MPSRLKLWMLALALVCMGSQRASAQPQVEPKQLVERTIQAAFKVLRDDKLKTQSKERMRALRAVVDQAFDWDAMAKSSLGAPWRDLNDKQRGEFVGVFKELLAQRYMDDIDRFQGSEELTVTGAEQQAERSLVKTVLLTSGHERIPIDYELYPSAAGWRVDDVSIEGVSLVNHYRKTFRQFLTNKSFAELMQQLKRKLGVASVDRVDSGQVAK